MYAGDSFPPAEFELSDEKDVLDLSGALSLEAIFDGATHKFSGPALAIQPPTIDADGIHKWNCKYVFATNDTQFPDVYIPFVVVTWSAGNVQTYPTGDKFTVLTAPVP